MELTALRLALQRMRKELVMSNSGRSITDAILTIETAIGAKLPIITMVDVAEATNYIKTGAFSAPFFIVCNKDELATTLNQKVAEWRDYYEEHVTIRDYKICEHPVRNDTGTGTKMQIWRYEVDPVDDVTELDMPVGANIVHIEVPNDGEPPSMWAIVYPTAPYERRYFSLLPSGWDLPPNCHYLGTCVLDGGVNVFHIVKLFPKQELSNALDTILG